MSSDDAITLSHVTFITTVFPAAKAGASFQAIIKAGKFLPSSSHNAIHMTLEAGRLLLHYQQQHLISLQ